MPLVKGDSKKAIAENIKIERDNGKPEKQAIAIAYSVAREAEKHKKAHHHKPEVKSTK